MALVEACIRFLDVLDLEIEFGVEKVVIRYKSDTDQSQTSLFVFRVCKWNQGPLYFYASVCANISSQGAQFTNKSNKPWQKTPENMKITIKLKNWVFVKWGIKTEGFKLKKFNKSIWVLKVKG